MEKDVILHKFGQCLAKARRRNGITQEAICDKTEMMKNTVSDLERGQSDSRFFTIYFYAQAANISLAEVFSDFENIPLVKSEKLQEIVNLLYNVDEATMETFLKQAKLLLDAIKKS